MEAPGEKAVAGAAPAGAAASAGPTRTVIPPIVTENMNRVFSYLFVVWVFALGIDGGVKGYKLHQLYADEVYGVYYFAAALAVIGLLVQLFVDKRNPGLTKDGRFDLGIGFFAYAIIRLESTREVDNLYFMDQGWALASDLLFFFGFVGAKLTNSTSSREVGLLVMSCIVDYIELTYSIKQYEPGGEMIELNTATRDAIVAFTFIFIMASPLISKMETRGQKSLNALVQIIIVHLPIICIRAAIPINEGGMYSFNAIFIAKNCIELCMCIVEFLEAGASVRMPTEQQPAYERI